MKRLPLPVICLLLIATGCSTIRKIPRHEGERIVGDLQLQIDVPGGDQQGRRYLDAKVDLDKRRWSGVLGGQRIRYCIYRLDGNRLFLELCEEIRSITRSATRTYFDPEGNPMTILDKTGERIEWLVISIEGEFTERGSDFVGGSFQGSARQSQVTRTYTRRSQRWDEMEEPGWEGAVTAICMLKERQVARLQVIGPG